MGGLQNEPYHKLKQSLAEITASIDELFDKNNLDALILPGGLGPDGSKGHVVAAADGYPIVGEVINKNLSVPH